MCFINGYCACSGLLPLSNGFYDTEKPNTHHNDQYGRSKIMRYFWMCLCAIVSATTIFTSSAQAQDASQCAYIGVPLRSPGCPGGSFTWPLLKKSGCPSVVVYVSFKRGGKPDRTRYFISKKKGITCCAPSRSCNITDVQFSYNK